jgi:uracil-DNA glycosylase
MDKLHALGMEGKEIERLTTNRLSPDGPEDSTILLLGQAPGEEEDISLKPFEGPAGQLLNRALKTVGLNRSELLVHNVFDQRPPRNEVGYFFSDKGKKNLTWEGQEHVDRLEAWLKQLLRNRKEGFGGPNVLVALGREPMLILTGRDQITKWRGSLLPCTLVEGFKVYPTFHPSYVNRLMNEPEERLQGERKIQKQNAYPLFLLDLKRIQTAAMTHKLVEVPKREHLVAESVEEVKAYFRVALETNRTTHLAVDIETLRSETGPVVWCIGFAYSPDGAMVIPFIRNQRLFWSLEDETQIWRAISEVFLNESIQKIASLEGITVSGSRMEHIRIQCYTITRPIPTLRRVSIRLLLSILGSLITKMMGKYGTEGGYLIPLNLNTTQKIVALHGRFSLSYEETPSNWAQNLSTSGPLGFSPPSSKCKSEESEST